MHTRIIVVSVASVVQIGAFSGCAEKIDTPAEFVELALRHERESEFAEAAAAYKHAIELDPKSAATWYDLGVAFAAQDKLPEAVEAYSKAIELDSTLERAFNNRAAVYARLKQFDRAIEDCTQALALDPADALAWRNRGLALHAQGDFEKAAADFDESIRIDGRNAETYQYRGDVYLELQDPVRALEDFDHALHLDTDLGEAWLGRAKSLSALDRSEDAQSALAQSRQLGTESPDDILSQWGAAAAPVPVVSATDTAAVRIAAEFLKAEYPGLKAATAPWDLMSTDSGGRQCFVVRVADMDQSVQFSDDELQEFRRQTDVSATLVVLKQVDAGNLEIAAVYSSWNGDSTGMQPSMWTLHVPSDDAPVAPMPASSGSVTTVQ